ncbi:hypothetical protein CV093_03980 [Oceanobacillus sp. 143]|uniref:Uncharacterized protein n=1 Tax=Oceanobacillus zhaokaii TaxID=2052660 RepID=A0A345PDS4_9BACI|nr:hypothetical protein [Oceanobacillus zhaokaii]AXI08154.1 hypothetical protein CUC15_03865 [Oceanobacillus zhaokaii]QGS68100.1 hypothetical protein CV093_03980 [Oceanobacillus sp. 143]
MKKLLRDKKRFLNKYWRDLISIFSLILTMIGFFLAVHVYNKDVRPVIENSELYQQIEELKEQKKEVDGYVNTKLKEIEDYEIQIGQIKSEKSLLESENEELESELIKSYRNYYLDITYLEIKQEELLSIRSSESFNIDVKQVALDFLQDQDPQESPKQKGLKQAKDYIKKYITPKSDYIDIISYEIKDIEEEMSKTD